MAKKLVLCCCGLAVSLAAVFAVVQPRLNAGETKASQTVVGILFGDVVVTASNGGDEKNPELAIFPRGQGGIQRTTYSTYHPDYLDGHPQRLQACFDQIWQMKTSHFLFLANLSGGTSPWVNSDPGWIVRMKMGGPKPGPKEVGGQDVGGPAAGDLLAKAIPRLDASVEDSKNEPAKKPVLYYDFAICRLCRLTPDHANGPRIEGAFFIQHRFEPQPFIVAMPFPVSSLRDQVPESFAVPFCEPFYCAVDEINNYYFVTESGAMISVPLSNNQKGTRQAKPFLADPGWRAKVLLRDAKSGWSMVFAEHRTAGKPDKALMTPLLAHCPHRDLPADYFSSKDAKSDQALLLKCAAEFRLKTYPRTGLPMIP